ncbi:PEPxxWA-CTERM sorting domain-containing protein [Parasphingorhabdus cellanae]|uniref:PEP-CTERM sorting domain-containing protein n=1 Tax=Parasphingorhabdus cellanae TaxID=2806553 RepID=A0ABX7T5G3_9SPHN|nr:PEPxxWA-CTERM sorting domain-containing protein [Parasphingorhabdus cellanae]QTD55485.1 PEP-CTERM sorting domain-containing protein [Parasphingorhabdus cellanae]
MKKLIFGSAAVVAMALTAPAQAAVISFDGLSGGNGSVFTGPYVEDGFTVSAGRGDIFEGQLFGNPAPSLVVGSVFGGGPIGSVQVLGGVFNFNSFDLVTQNGTGDYQVDGFLNGSSVFSLMGSLSPSGFQTIGGLAGNIDQLNFTLTANGTSVNLDNINVSAAVPEPATWAFMILGFGAIGGALRRRKANVKVSYA